MKEGEVKKGETVWALLGLLAIETLLGGCCLSVVAIRFGEPRIDFGAGIAIVYLALSASAQIRNQIKKLGEQP